MSLQEKEYKVAELSGETKRVCLALDLKDDPELMEKYKWYHKPENNWQEINDAIIASGVQIMDIYLIDNHMFMICDVASEADFDEVWNKMGTYPRQGEWAELMATFQQALPGRKLEWVKMERVFTLNK
jgi:L-rhamnose mutarotase